MQFSRSFAAPRATVWKFWTEPACLAEWFGPTGDTSGEVYPACAACNDGTHIA